MNTVSFFLASIPFPVIKIDDYLRQAASDIITILTSSPSTTVPTLNAGDKACNALLEIVTILNQATDLPTAPILPQRSQQPLLVHNEVSPTVCPIQ